MAAKHEVRLVDQVLEELLNNIGEEIITELVEQQEGVMDKDEQARPFFCPFCLSKGCGFC